jgi:hypothetical protein
VWRRAVTVLSQLSAVRVADLNEKKEKKLSTASPSVD